MNGNGRRTELEQEVGVGVKVRSKGCNLKFVLNYSEMSYCTGNDLEQGEESDGSDLAWDTTNEEGASLDQSLIVVGCHQGEDEQGQRAGDRGGGQGPDGGTEGPGCGDTGEQQPAGAVTPGAHLAHGPEGEEGDGAEGRAGR